MKTFNLKQFRSSNGLTLKDVAQSTGIPSIHLSEIERGLRPISALYMEKIKTSFSQLIQKTEDPKPNRLVYKSETIEQ